VSFVSGQILMKFGDERYASAGEHKLLYDYATYGNTLIQEARTSEVDMLSY
jgi:hypothetical protein